jgi:hypothetical protein
MRYYFPILKSWNHVYDTKVRRVPKYKWLRKLLEFLNLMEDDREYLMRKTYETFDIMEEDIVTLLRRGMTELMVGTHLKPTRIYVGYDQFEALCNHLATSMSGPFKMPFKFQGAEIIATPYLEGILPVWEKCCECEGK